MADSAVAITAGVGTNVDTRTESTNGQHRQVVVLGDPDTNTGVAPVDATNGLAVDVKQSALPSGASTLAEQQTQTGHLADLAGAVAGTEVQVDVVSSALPTGAATSANQSTAITHLSEIEGAVETIETAKATIGTTDLLRVAVFDASNSQITSFGGSAGTVSTAHLITAGSGDATSVKNAAGTLRSVHIFNKSAVPIYAKFHDTASAPTPGTGVVLTVACQAGVARDFTLPGGGRSFATGIGLSVVTGIADNDSTGVASGDASIEVSYE